MKRHYTGKYSGSFKYEYQCMSPGGGHQQEKCSGEDEDSRGSQMVMEGDETLGGEHTMQYHVYTDDIS